MQGKACRKQDLGSCENLSLQDTEQFKSQILEGNIQAVVLIYDNLLLKGTQIQSWWLVPLNCAPPYNNADIVCSGQLALPDVRLASVGEDARVPVGHLSTRAMQLPCVGVVAPRARRPRRGLNARCVVEGAAPHARRGGAH